MIARVALALSLLVGGGWIAPKEETPEATVEAFVKAWNARDLKSAALRVVDGKPLRDYTEVFREVGTPWPNVTMIDLKIVVEGSTAAGTAKLKIVGKGMNETVEDSFVLTLVDKEWKLSRIRKDKFSTLHQMAEVTVTPNLLSTVKAEARERVCWSNMTRLATRFIMFAADHDDVFKIDPSRARATIGEIGAYGNPWHCPSDPAAVSYRFNARLAGKKMEKIKDPAKTIMIYEGSKEQLSFRHDGRAHVATVEGRTLAVTPKEAKALRWDP